MSDDKPSLSYRDAGVNIDAADESLGRAKEAIKRTFDPNVLQDIGSFGAMYNMAALNVQNPVLVSSVDGVGTKLKVAFMMGVHDTVGVDLVSHCVNDILVQGARPLFFLDYLACGVMEPETISDVITGIATGCRYAGCSLIGGETAEMPGMYADGEYDLAGTIVGVVDRDKIVDGSRIQEGDAIIAIPSTGLHTNGYSLARKICFEVAGMDHSDPMPGTGMSVGEALLAPHREYARVMQIAMKLVDVRAMVHVTGGGLTDNLPRVLPEGLGAEINLEAWEIPAIFRFLQETGNVKESEMLRTFNCGQGFLVIVPKDQADKALDTISQAVNDPILIGSIINDDKQEVAYKGSARYASID